MSAINEQTKWEDEVYLLAREDRVEGGIYGPSNKQARQLANRTRYLKTAVESLQDYRDYTFFMTPDDPDGRHPCGACRYAGGETLSRGGA